MTHTAKLRGAFSTFGVAVIAATIVGAAGECGAAMIFIVTDHQDREAGYAAFLEDHGFTAGVSESGEFRGSLSPDQRSTLESYDLLIVSRNTGSGDYNYPGDWNTLDVPILLHAPHIVRGSIWDWQPDSEVRWREADAFGLGRVREDGNPDFLPEDVMDHPIFSGIEFATVESDQTGPREGIILAEPGHETRGTRDNTGSGGGSNGIWLLSELEYETAMLIDFTDAIGDPFYGNSSQTIHDRRVFFSFTDSYSDFADIPLTPQGERLLLNAVNFTIPEPGAWLMLLAAAACGLLARRRK